MFLTDSELESLTGLRQPAAQIRFLRSRRIRHIVNRAGHPVVAQAWVIGDRDVVVALERPNLAALKRA